MGTIEDNIRETMEKCGKDSNALRDRVCKEPLTGIEYRNITSCANYYAGKHDALVDVLDQIKGKDI